MNHASALSNLEEVGHGHPQTQVQAAHDSTWIWQLKWGTLMGLSLLTPGSVPTPAS